MFGHVLRVTTDTVDGVRRPSVHPFQAEEIQAVQCTDSSDVLRFTQLITGRGRQPAMTGGEAGGPDDAADAVPAEAENRSGIGDSESRCRTGAGRRCIDTLSAEVTV